MALFAHLTQWIEFALNCSFCYRVKQSCGVFLPHLHTCPSLSILCTLFFSLSSFYLCSILLMLLKNEVFLLLMSFWTSVWQPDSKNNCKDDSSKKKMGGKYKNIEEKAWQQAPFKMSRCLDLIVKFNLSRCFPNGSLVCQAVSLFLSYISPHFFPGSC